MTIATGTPHYFERQDHRRRRRLHRRRHRPLHRRRSASVRQIFDTSRFIVGLATLPLHRCAKLIRDRDYRAIGMVIAAIAWIGVVVSHFLGIHEGAGVFAAIEALTWGQAAISFAPTDDGLEFFLASLATSVATLLIIGMLLVEIRLTSFFLIAFIVIGAVSLLLQAVAYRQQSGVRTRVRL